MHFCWPNYVRDLVFALGTIPTFPPNPNFESDVSSSPPSSGLVSQGQFLSSPGIALNSYFSSSSWSSMLLFQQGQSTRASAPRALHLFPLALPWISLLQLPLKFLCTSGGA